MSETLWRRILDRFRMTRGLTRPRVPLVLRRAAGPHAAGQRGSDRRWFHTTRNQYAVHVHLSWPRWLIGPRDAAPGVGVALSRPGLVPRTPLTSARGWSTPAAVGRTSPSPSRNVPAPSRFVPSRPWHAAPVASAPGTTPLAAAFAPAVHRVQAGDTEPRPLAVASDTTLFTSVQRRMAAWATSIREDVEPLRTLVTRATRGIHSSAQLQVTRRLAAAAQTTSPAASPAGPPAWVPPHSYTHAAPRMVKAQGDAGVSVVSPQPARTIERSAAPHRPEAAAPALDIDRLSEEVYRQIQKRVRIERERRGL